MLANNIKKAIIIALCGALYINTSALPVKAVGEKTSVFNSNKETEDEYIVNSDRAGQETGSKTITGFGEFVIRDHYITIQDSDRPSLEEIVSMMPESLEVQLDGETETSSIPVTWYAITEDYDEQEKYYYQFNPEWDDELYVLSEKLDEYESIPYIGVFVEAANPVTSGKKNLKSSAPVTGKANETEVYNYLRNNMGVNVAVACGVLANIQCESSFNPTASVIDTNGLESYGICQWNGGRNTALKNYCQNNGYSYSTIQGQMHYLQYELSNSEKSAWSMVNGQENSSSGAYTAGYNWAKYFERCAEYYNGRAQYVERANLARDNYWPAYSSTSYGKLDVNFTVDGQNQYNILKLGIGTIEVYIDGTLWSSGGTNTYGDFCDDTVPIGSTYEVRVKITDQNYWCSGTVEGRRRGTTAANTVVNLNIQKKGYDRVLPDGDYIIATAGANDKESFYFLDIEGKDYPAANNTNVVICGPGTPVGAYDVWTLEYDESDKFYTIYQKGTNMCLDVAGDGTGCGSGSGKGNIHVYSSSGTLSTHKWAIKHDGGTGYLVQAKSSGYCLDVSGGNTNTSGTNVQQWDIANVIQQSWLFVPFEPAQEVEEGRYVLLSGLSSSYELGVPGDTGSIADNTAVKLRNNSAPSRYNSFDITKLDNGYYSVIHAASGKALGINGGGSNNETSASLMTSSGNHSQQWSITGDGSGYTLRVMSSGYALDVSGGVAEDGRKIQQYPVNGSASQVWTFVKAEHTVQYNANGGSGAPGVQTKYYKTNLTLSSTLPTRSGYEFTGWAESSSATSASYQPGGTYTSDKNTTLYAVWKNIDYTLTFDMNGGEGSIAPIHIQGSSTCTIPSTVPTRTGYDFKGWARSKTATTADYAAGDIYPGGTATLYAVWKIKTFTVSFDSDGAGSYASVTVAYGNTIGNLPVPEKSGLFFKGWFTSNGTKVTADTVVKENLALTARWSEPSRMTLPGSLTAIEDEAFMGTAPNVVVIPEHVASIGQRAFADNSDLYTAVVYASSMTIASDAFGNCPHLTVYGYSDTSIEHYCTAEGIPFVALDGDSYILNDDLPVGASVTDEKWTYTQSTTETTTSPETSLPGWTQTGEYTWETTGTGTYKYASYPSGFDTGNSLYSKYNKSALSSTPEGNTQREVSDPTFLTYIYWHWTFVDSVSADHASGGHNVFIRDARLLKEVVSGSTTRDFIYFDAFESTEDQGTVGPRDASSTYDIGQEGGYYYWRDNDADASQWWWRFNVYQQTYTDSRKIFTYTRTTTEERESSTPVEEDGIEISNVRHMVRYTF